jgi:TPR repeat protein
VVAPQRRRLGDARAGERSDEQATMLEYFENVADAGDAHAQTMLGQLHLVGQQGVGRDHARAVQLLRRAVAQGGAWAGCSEWVRHGGSRPAADHDAKAYLAYMYAQGVGVPRDTAMALQLYTDAAARGSTAAMTGLGQLYLLGLGVDQQPDKAFKHLSTAARSGSPHAQYYLGLMYTGASAAAAAAASC